MDATPEPAAEPAPLSPRMEQFCRVAARGESLAEAARRAGYAPASARQRGSELWARDDVQARISVLRAGEENREQAMIENMRRKYERMVDFLWAKGKIETVARIMAQWWRFEKDVRAQRTLTPRERERLHEEVRDDLREQMRPEIAEELRAEMREEIAAKLRAEIGAELRAQAGPVRTMTKQDVGRVSASPMPATTKPATPKPPATGRSMTNRDELDEIEALLAASLHAEGNALERALLRDRSSPSLQALLAGAP